MTCDHCKDNFFDFPTCQPCQCHVNGSNGLDCNDDGICICKPNIDGNKCDKCKTGYQGHPLCDKCQPSFFGYPNCQGNPKVNKLGFCNADLFTVVCGCNANGSINQTCNNVGNCTCKSALITGAKCDRCLDGYFGFPDCKGIEVL